MQRYSFRHIFTPDGMLHDRTLAVGPDGRIAALEPAAPGTRFDGFLALPGIPNAHSHAFQRALAGFGEVPSAAGRDSFWSWREAMYRLAQRVTPEQCGAIARHAYAEMLAAGFTSVAEFHYLHHGVDGARGVEMAQAVVEAARAAGIRLTLLPAQGGGKDVAEKGIQIALNDEHPGQMAALRMCVVRTLPVSMFEKSNGQRSAVTINITGLDGAPLQIGGSLRVATQHQPLKSG